MRPGRRKREATAAWRTATRSYAQRSARGVCQDRCHSACFSRICSRLITPSDMSVDSPELLLRQRVNTMPYTLNVNGKATTVDVPADMPLLWVLQRRPEPEGHQVRLRHRPVRRLHRATAGPRQRSCQTPVSQAAGAADHHDRRAVGRRHRTRCSGRGRRSTCRSAATARPARSCRRRRCCRTNPRPTRRADQHRDERQPVPLRHLPAHSRRPSSARRQSRASRPTQTARRRRGVGGGAMTKHLVTRRSFLRVTRHRRRRHRVRAALRRARAVRPGAAAGPAADVRGARRS